MRISSRILFLAKVSCLHKEMVKSLSYVVICLTFSYYNQGHSMLSVLLLTLSLSSKTMYEHVQCKIGSIGHFPN